jgi:hypothetical protein
MGKSMPTFIHDSVRSIKSKSCPKEIRSVEEDTNFGKASLFQIVRNYSRICGSIDRKFYVDVSRIQWS